MRSIRIFGGFHTMKRAATLAFATALSCLVSGNLMGIPANADDIVSDVVKGTLGAAGSVLGAAGDIVSGTIDAAGNIIDASGRVIGSVAGGTANLAGAAVSTAGNLTGTAVGTTADVLDASLGYRRSEIERTLSAELAAGRLTATQVAEVRAELDRIAQAEAAARLSGNVFTFDEAVIIGRDLDTLGTRIHTIVPTVSYAPLVVVNEGTPRLLINARKMGDKLVIVKAPTVVATPATTVVATPATPVVPSTTVVTTPPVTTQSTTVIATEPAATTVTTAAAPIKTSTMIVGDPATVMALLDSRRVEIDRLIGNALLSTKISAADAASLRAELDAINASFFAARTGNTIAMDKAVVIARDLDALSTKVVSLAHTTPITPIAVTESGTTRIVSDIPASKIVSVTTVKPDIFVTTLDTRRTELEKLISSALSAGRLTPAQVAVYKADLTRLAGEQAIAVKTPNGFTYMSALPLALEYDLLVNRLGTVIDTSAVHPLVVGSRLALATGEVVMFDDVVVRRAELRAKIGRELASGRLTSRQASDLLKRLDDITSREAKMRSDGNLDYREARELYADFDRIGSRLDSDISSNR